jgi:type II secretory pathway component PulM
LEKERKKKLRALKKLEKKAQKERRIFERYLEKERIRAEEQAVREKEKAAREAEKAARKAERQEGAKEEAVRDSSSKKGLSSKTR